MGGATLETLPIPASKDQSFVGVRRSPRGFAPTDGPTAPPRRRHRRRSPSSRAHCCLVA